MAYRVEIAPSALTDAEDAYLWMHNESPTRAASWYNGLLEEIYSLESFPTRCPVAAESEEIGHEIRQILYGQRSATYRILFSLVVDERTGEEVVRVYRVWHGARDRFGAEDLGVD